MGSYKNTSARKYECLCYINIWLHNLFFCLFSLKIVFPYAIYNPLTEMHLRQIIKLSLIWDVSTNFNRIKIFKYKFKHVLLFVFNTRFYVSFSKFSCLRHTLCHICSYSFGRICSFYSNQYQVSPKDRINPSNCIV